MKKRYQRNQQIKAKELRVITTEGENLGVMKTQDALKKAIEADLDLVVISENTEPPIAKILDFNKFLYDENKKAAAAKAKSKKSELKELRFGPNIGDGDLNQRIERATEFLEDGNRVRFTIQLRGRQRAFPEVGFEKLERITKELAQVGQPEGSPKREGSFIRVTFVRK